MASLFSLHTAELRDAFTLFDKKGDNKINVKDLGTVMSASRPISQHPISTAPVGCMRWYFYSGHSTDTATSFAHRMQSTERSHAPLAHRMQPTERSHVPLRYCCVIPDATFHRLHATLDGKKRRCCAIAGYLMSHLDVLIASSPWQKVKLPLIYPPLPPPRAWTLLHFALPLQEPWDRTPPRSL